MRICVLDQGNYELLAPKDCQIKAEGAYIILFWSNPNLLMARLLDSRLAWLEYFPVSTVPSWWLNFYLKFSSVS